MLQRTST